MNFRRRKRTWLTLTWFTNQRLTSHQTGHERWSPGWESCVSLRKIIVHARWHCRWDSVSRIFHIHLITSHTARSLFSQISDIQYYLYFYRYNAYVCLSNLVIVCTSGPSLFCWAPEHHVVHDDYGNAQRDEQGAVGGCTAAWPGPIQDWHPWWKIFSVNLEKRNEESD